MNKLFRLSLGAIALATALLAGAQTIYNPTRTVKDQGASLKSWGSGTISETDELSFEGTTSIRISSRNYFQGGIITFQKPIDLNAAYPDKNNLLVLTMHVPSEAQANGGGNSGKSGKSGALGGPDGAGSLSTNPGAKGGSDNGVPTTTPTSSAVLEKIRVIVTTSDGMRSEAFLETKGKVGDAKGWIKASVPLQAISGFEKTNKSIQSIAISGDAVATFYIGEASISSDSTPIYGEINQTNLNLALGDTIQFVGSGYGGATPLKFEWDFDSSDGIQIDSTGSTVKRKFRKPGDFVITLTITDMFGLKAPYKTTAKVTVNP